MPNRLDDFVCEITPEEYETQYIAQDLWRDALYAFCEEMEIEPEVYED